ncbi:Nucleoporin nup84 [Clarireedia jacksonii]
MAPMTRSSATGNGTHAGGLDVPRNQNFREGSWQLISQSSPRFERGTSEGPSSYDGDEMASRNGEDADYGKPAMTENNPDNDDVLYPLKDAANRVGNEVERFAEFLDGYNPLKVTDGDDRREMAFDLIELYHKIALETLDRLRDRHESERRKLEGLSWRRKMRGLKITQDTDEMELEDSDAEDQFVTNSKTTVKDLVRWEQEAQTWDLLKRLAHLRFSDSSTAQNPEQQRSPIHQYSNERDVWEHFLETDKLALERKTVLRWLQDTAEESGEEIDVLVQDLQQNADRGDIIAHGWLHTKAAIKNLKRVNSWARPLDPASAEVQNAAWNTPKTEPLVTQLDPDSVTRQGRKLEAQDEYFERAIWLGCYEMLRRGRSAAEIREWCMDRTEIWRAVSMSGLPDEQPLEGDEEGNPASGALWRRMCFALARKGGNDEYERAVYGILSGDISSVEPVCRTWDDFVFTHYNALLRTQFDQYIQSVHPQGVMNGTLNFSALDAIVLHGDNSTAGNRLVENLKTDARTSQETLQPMKMLQGVLIADQFAYFIHQQGLALSKFANEHTTSNLIPPSSEQPKDLDITKYVDLADHDSLRVLTHVLLIFRSLGLDFGGILKESVIENVIVAYITFLRLANKGELIPLYCSQLSGARRYATLSRNLIDVTDPGQRVTQIRLMRELGLDVQQFVKFQSRFLFQDYLDETKDYPASKMFNILDDNGRGGKKVRKDFFGEDPDEVDRVDLLFIRSLEWYLLVDGLWAETFQVGRMLYQRFFKHMHLNAARCLASRVPSSDIARSKTPALLGESLDFDSLESDNDDDLTEVLDGSANNKRLIKRYMAEQAKNFRELETLVMALDHIETIAATYQIFEEIEDQKWQSELKRGVAQAFRPAAICIPALFRGWLTTSQSAEPEFKILRETYLPQTILGWISQLEMAGVVLTRDFLMDAMDLATIVAAEDSDLLELFASAGRMPELVDALANCSKQLLISTSSKRGTATQSKKMRAKGWTHELWNVKP